MEKKKEVHSLNGAGVLGTAIAVTISWSINKSIMWAMFHGLFGWIYVIYYAIMRSKGVM